MFFEIHPVLCPGFLVLLKMAPKSSSKVYVLQNEDKSYLVVFDLANLVCEILTEAFFQATFLGI